MADDIIKVPGFLLLSESEIMAAMLEAVPDDLDKSEGSYVWDALKPAALELSQAYSFAEMTMRRAFVLATYNDWLALRADERGLTRHPAHSATGEVLFTGDDGAFIPEGTRVATEGDVAAQIDPVEYETTEDATIPVEGEVLVPVRAVEDGTGGNVGAGTVVLMVRPVGGVSAVTNPDPITGGGDEETDEALRERYFIAVRTPALSGSKSDYERWALEVTGVGRARCLPLWDGNGTVKVVLVDTQMLPATPEVVNAVQDYIDPVPGTGEGLAPIGAEFTAAAATGIDIDITATVEVRAGHTLGEAQETFETAVIEYLRGTVALQTDLVRYVRIGTLLLDQDAVIDYSDLEVNTGTANIVLDLDEVPVLGTVTLSE